MKKWICLFLSLALALAGCGKDAGETTLPVESALPSGSTTALEVPDTEVIPIILEGESVSVPEGAGVWTDHDIVYYEAGHDFTYGEGEPGDEHEASEAEAHTVIHITEPGTYRISGTMSAGQIAVDLGEDAEDDPNGVVTLILDGVDITCTVAPAIIFYNVYECGSADIETAGPVVDTSEAGANVVLAEGSENIVNGSYVARIYKEGTVVLNEDGTEVEDAKKLHKYDAALYSKMTMNVSGSGSLTINAENEGLDSELHLTINGGDITINSGNDGINTNEDGVSVTTVNGGRLTINVLGTTGEGDGIDSNGWLVINGGTVNASACGFSGDAGIDSDMGIYLNGGTVAASGHMLDRIAGGNATYVVFQFASTQKGGNTYTLKNEAGDTVLECTPANDFSTLILSGDGLTPGNYSFWMGDTRLAGASGGRMGGGWNGGMPGQIPDRMPEGDYQIPPQPSMPMEPQGGEPGDWMPGREEGETPSMPEGEMPTMPEGAHEEQQGGRPGNWMDGRPEDGRGGDLSEQLSDTFPIVQGENQFMQVGPAE